MTDHTALLTRIVRAGEPVTLHQLNYTDLADAIAILGRAVLDATPGDAGACYYCMAEGEQPHQVSCPVPVARAMLTYTDD